MPRLNGQEADARMRAYFFPAPTFRAFSSDERVHVILMYAFFSPSLCCSKVQTPSVNLVRKILIDVK